MWHFFFICTVNACESIFTIASLNQVKTNSFPHTNIRGKVTTCNHQADGTPHLWFVIFSGDLQTKNRLWSYMLQMSLLRLGVIKQHKTLTKPFSVILKGMVAAEVELSFLEWCSTICWSVYCTIELGKINKMLISKSRTHIRLWILLNSVVISKIGSFV